MSSKNNQEELSPIEEIKKEYLEKIDYFGNRRSKYALYKKFSKKYNLNKRVFLYIINSSIKLMKMLEAQKDMNWDQTEPESKKRTLTNFKKISIMK